MKKSIAINGLHYLPRQNGGSNGTIGKYQVALSTNGTTWSAPVAAGVWADDATEKTAAFTLTSARYVRLTALTEAGNRGPWSSAAEINILQPVNPAVAGAWGPLINFPIVPVSAVLLPNNKLLTFSAYQATSFGMNDGYTQTAILDLSTGVVSQRQVSNTGHEMFCTGLALLPDGRVLVNGGSDSGKTSIYNPATDAWTAGPAMNIPRGYEGDTTLSDGSVFTLGGSWSGGEGNKNAEVFTPNGSWRLVKNVTAASILTSADPQGVYREDNHGWFFATSNGGVFHAGPSKQMNWFTTAGDGSTRSAGLRGDSADAMNGNAVMYDVGKILTDGGATAYQDADATRRAYTIDISKGPSSPVTVQRVGDMAASARVPEQRGAAERPGARRRRPGAPRAVHRHRGGDVAGAVGSGDRTIQHDGQPGRATQLSQRRAVAARRTGVLRGRRVVRHVRDQPSGRADLHPAVPAQRGRVVEGAPGHLVGTRIGAARQHDQRGHEHAR